MNETDGGILARLERIEPALLAVTILIAIVPLAAWFFPPLAESVPSVWLRLRPPTAAALIFTALALGLSNGRRPPWAEDLGTGIALGLVFTPAFGLIAFSGLLSVPEDRLANLPPLTNMLATLASFVAIFFSRESSGVRAVLADAGTAVLLTAFLFLAGGYIFNGLELTGAGGVPLQSPPTLLALGSVAFVLVARRAAADGLFGFLVQNGIGSRIARTVLPAVALMPFVVFEAASLMEYAGMSVAIGRAVVAPLVAMIGVVVVVWMGRRTNWIESQLRQQSFTDQLTGLLNQRGFEDATLSLGRRAAATDGGVIAFFFDLDNLKRANDLLGHTAGSQVIQRFADLLAVTFRKSDVIGRVGGDEFVVLAPAPAETADDMLRRFARVVETLNATEYIPVPISYSVGYAELEAGDAGDLAGLIAEADARMYAQKSRKRAA